MRIRLALTVGLRREVDIEKILDGFLNVYAYGYFFEQGYKYRKILDGKYVNEPAYTLKRTRTKRLWLLRSIVHCYVMNFVYNQKRCTLLRHELCLQSEALYIVTSWTLFTIRSVIHCYVMNFVYNQTRCTLLRHELCLQSWSHEEQKPCPLSAYKSWYTHACIVTLTRILLLHRGLLKELLWMNEVS